MPRRLVKVFASKKGKKRAFVRRVTRGTLLAATLVATQFDGAEAAEKLRLFNPGMLDRLRTPLMRYHE